MTTNKITRIIGAIEHWRPRLAVLATLFRRLPIIEEEDLRSINNHEIDGTLFVTAVLTLGEIDKLPDKILLPRRAGDVTQTNDLELT